MSRKCPKRHHLFLNWLCANRGHFPFEPHVTKIENRNIDFVLRGLSKTLRFRFTPRAWIAVDVMWQGEEWTGLSRFYGAEVRSGAGWMTLREAPETRHRLWRTREELWQELCFEEFLAWCRRELTPGCWLELYDGCSLRCAKIQPADARPRQFMASWEAECIALARPGSSRINQLVAEARYLPVPLFTWE